MAEKITILGDTILLLMASASMSQCAAPGHCLLRSLHLSKNWLQVKAAPFTSAEEAEGVAQVAA